MEQVTTTLTTGGATRCLGVHIDGADEPVLVPLLTELPRRQFRDLTRAIAKGGTEAEDLVEAFLAGYLGRDVVDGMRQADFNALVQAWADASQAEAGASLGE